MTAMKFIAEAVLLIIGGLSVIMIFQALDILAQVWGLT